ncbi:MAG: alanine racemase [Candidatus Chlorobium antarcticum]|nr:alanine racemase [Candidatus Chlorobium antarcticum]
MPAPTPEPMAEAIVSLQHLQHNLSEIQKRTGEGVRIMGVVKANAYGHDVHKVSETLEQNGVSDFGVANIQEAIDLQTGGALKKASSILAFASPLPSQIPLYLQHGIEMTLCNRETLLAAESIAAATGKKLTVHIKVDTGMGRLGLPPAAAMELLRASEQCRRIEVKGMYTHFADSSGDMEFTRRQLSDFLSLTTEYEHASGKRLLKHAANSGAILSLPEANLDMVRPGITLYGYHPAKETDTRLNLKPVMQVEAKVVFLKTVPAGTTISYGRTWTAPAITTIATVAAGYADGYPRSLSGKGATVTANGQSYPQVGTITMDQIMVNLGTRSTAKVGDRVILFGWEGPSTAETIADLSGTISYEILCAVSRRAGRVFR